MNATFQVQTIAKHHNGDVEVTLGQVYDHTTRQLNDSTNPEGEITLQITDRTGFFQQGQKYFVNFRSTAPAVSRSLTLANGEAIDPAEQEKWVKENPGKTPADFVVYKNAQTPDRFYRGADGTHDNDPHRLDGLNAERSEADFNQNDPNAPAPWKRKQKWQPKADAPVTE